MCEKFYGKENSKVSRNIEQTRYDLVQWIKDFFETNGKGCNAVVGISGGKDSSVVAALCCEALGKDRVLGVLMPNRQQHDIECSHELCRALDIKNVVLDIGDAVDGVLKSFTAAGIIPSEQSLINLPARIRMSTLYAFSQTHNGRVANTCNLSEDYVGYATRYGDAAGDFSPLSSLTVTEVKQIGMLLGLPKHLVDKTPIDGLCGRTDEDNLGFTYDTLDKYIRTGICEDKAIKEKIDQMQKKNRFKLQLMPSSPSPVREP